MKKLLLALIPTLGIAAHSEMSLADAIQNVKGAELMAAKKEHVDKLAKLTKTLQWQEACVRRRVTINDSAEKIHETALYYLRAAEHIGRVEKTASGNTLSGLSRRHIRRAETLLGYGVIKNHLPSIDEVVTRLSRRLNTGLRGSGTAVTTGEMRQLLSAWLRIRQMEAEGEEIGDRLWGEAHMGAALALWHMPDQAKSTPIQVGRLKINFHNVMRSIREMLTTAVRAKSVETDARYWLGRFFAAHGHVASARKNYEHVLAKMPLDVDARFSRAELLQTQGEEEKSLAFQDFMDIALQTKEAVETTKHPKLSYANWQSVRKVAEALSFGNGVPAHREEAKTWYQVWEKEANPYSLGEGYRALSELALADGNEHTAKVHMTFYLRKSGTPMTSVWHALDIAKTVTDADVELPRYFSHVRDLETTISKLESEIARRDAETVANPLWRLAESTERQVGKTLEQGQTLADEIRSMRSALMDTRRVIAEKIQTLQIQREDAETATEDALRLELKQVKGEISLLRDSLMQRKAKKG